MKFWNKKIEQKDTDFEYRIQIFKKSKKYNWLLFRRCLSLTSEVVPFRPLFRSHSIRSLRTRKNSVNDFNIPKEDISAIHPLMDRTNSTGCYSRELSLPTVDPGKHNGLKYISHETLVKLLSGKLAKGPFF